MPSTGSPSIAFPGSFARDDPLSGTREEAAFFGDRPRLFGVTHLPAGDPVAGIVVCSPYMAEFVRNYRREFDVARALSAGGLAVQRFHYRGTGSSGGEPADLTFESMVGDARAALEHLRDRTGVDRLGFFGTKVGGTVAAAVASDFPGAPLAIWDPVPDPATYFAGIFRGRLIANLRDGHAGTSRRELLEELEEAGVLDILGYPIAREMYRSVMARTLEGELGDGPRPVLLVQVGGREGHRSPHQTLASRLIGRGLAVETSLIPYAEAWWFGSTPELRADEVKRDGLMVRVTEEWIRRRFDQERIT